MPDAGTSLHGFVLRHRMSRYELEFVPSALFPYHARSMTLAQCMLTVDWNAPHRRYLHRPCDVVKRRERLRVNL
jgi:hypothetical protein